MPKSLESSAGCLGCLSVPIMVLMCSGVFSGLGTRGDAVYWAQQRGAEAGKNDGQRAGELDGFRTGFREAEARSYRNTLSELYSSRDYSRPVFIELAVMLGFFVLGYALQYCIFYLLRAPGFLSDIDWIVLTPEAKDKLKSVSCQQTRVSISQNPEYGQGRS